MRDLLHERFGKGYAPSTLCITLIRNRIICKRLSLISSRRHEYNRATYWDTMEHITADMCLFLDETTKAGRSLEHVYSRGPIGKRINTRRYFTRGVRGHSVLGVFTLDGMIDCYITNSKGRGHI